MHPVLHCELLRRGQIGLVFLELEEGFLHNRLLVGLLLVVERQLACVARKKRKFLLEKKIVAGIALQLVLEVHLLHTGDLNGGQVGFKPLAQTRDRQKILLRRGLVAQGDVLLVEGLPRLRVVLCGGLDHPEALFEALHRGLLRRGGGCRPAALLTSGQRRPQRAKQGCQKDGEALRVHYAT